MKKITIYTTEVCPYCVRAKALLKRKGLEFVEIDVSDEKDRVAMMEKSGGRRSVPQIFVGNHHVGGCDDLYALEKEGKLDELVE
jgi:glutaredoxin 3